jgi:hypothetical protein
MPGCGGRIWCSPMVVPGFRRGPTTFQTAHPVVVSRHQAVRMSATSSANNLWPERSSIPETVPACTRRHGVLDAPLSKRVDPRFREHASPPSRGAYASELLHEHRPLKNQRAWGMPDARCTRSLVCAYWSVSMHTSIHSEPPESPGIPARNGFNGFLRALLGDRACLVTVACGMNSANLNASVEASGPHDFAVRLRAHSSEARMPRPPHPAPTFVTIAKRPSIGTGWRINKAVSP